MIRIADVLLNPRRIKRHPFELIFIAFFYTSLSMFLGYWIFPEYSSLFSIFFSVISCVYVVQGILIVEERKENDIDDEFTVLKRHMKTLKCFLILFLGFLLAYIFWTIVLPQQIELEIFSIQKTEIENIRSITGSSINPGNFNIILINNFRVLMFSLILALFYGAGSVFILVWNASIMGFVIGSLAKNVTGLSSLPQIFLKYFIHGIPEMMAYFIVALIGGILFIEIIRGDLIKGKTKRTFTDIFFLLIIAIFLLIFAALIETYISPVI